MSKLRLVQIFITCVKSSVAFIGHWPDLKYEIIIFCKRLIIGIWILGTYRAYCISLDFGDFLCQYIVCLVVERVAFSTQERVWYLSPWSCIRCYQSGPRRNSNEGVLRIPQNSSITGISPSDCLVSYPVHSLWGGGSCPSPEESVYSIASADWVTISARLKICWLNPPQKSKTPSPQRKAVFWGGY